MTDGVVSNACNNIFQKYQDAAFFAGLNPSKSSEAIMLLFEGFDYITVMRQVCGDVLANMEDNILQVDSSLNAQQIGLMYFLILETRKLATEALRNRKHDILFFVSDN